MKRLQLNLFNGLIAFFCLVSKILGTELIIAETSNGLKKSYQVFSEGKKIGFIRGKFFKATGDTFTLFDQAGQFVLSETEIKRKNTLNRHALFKDAAGDQVAQLIGHMPEGDDPYTLYFEVKESQQQRTLAFSDDINLRNLRNFTIKTISRPGRKNGGRIQVGRKPGARDSYHLKARGVPSNLWPKIILMVAVVDAIKDDESR